MVEKNLINVGVSLEEGLKLWAKDAGSGESATGTTMESGFSLLTRQSLVSAQRGILCARRRSEGEPTRRLAFRAESTREFALLYIHTWET